MWFVFHQAPYVGAFHLEVSVSLCEVEPTASRIHEHLDMGAGHTMGQGIRNGNGWDQVGRIVSQPERPVRCIKIEGAATSGDELRRARSVSAVHEKAGREKQK